jgi:hypothetical protein
MTKHMTKLDIINRLLALPKEISTAENVLLLANNGLLSAKDVLQRKEDDLLFGNVIDGKNAEIRSAQMRQGTQTERENLSTAERDVKNAAVRLGALRDEFRALQSVAFLLKEDVA